MKNRMAALLAALLTLSLLAGCAPRETAATAPPQQETVPAPTIPADGDPKNVTAKGSYTADKPKGNAVVAKCGGAELTNEELQAWYWGAVASYDPAHNAAPDFSAPLDSQRCPVDGVNSWQQYFLKQALNNWHTAQALVAKGREAGLPVEPEFAPVKEYREANIVDMPVEHLMYRQREGFQPNTMHQAFLDGIPAMLDTIAQEMGYLDREDLAPKAFGTTGQALEDMVALYNRAYMYHTNLSYYIELSDEDVEQWYEENKAEYERLGITKDSGCYVDFRQILLQPEESEKYPGLTVTIAEDGTVTCGEELWAECEVQADKLVLKWIQHNRPKTEGAFADLANTHSKDAGTAADGGAYRQIAKGQMIGAIDDWCFQEGRKAKDYTVLRTEYGCHILYFVGKTPQWESRAREDLLAQKQRQQILDIRAEYPMEVDYTAIALSQAKPQIPMEQLLYADVAHERFPEVPVFLQQDYPEVMYGAYKIRTHGCGITSLAMLASYMTDDEWTPPELCRLYGRYNTEDGTDVTLFLYEPAVMGFYGRVMYRDADAWQALKDGHVLISLQKTGYWTGGGHYIVVEKMNEDGTVQVRDSNVFNYHKLSGHKVDKHAWSDITDANKVFWAFDKKLTRIPACSRCGSGAADLLREDYLCHKCRPAQLRREVYLSIMQ